MWQTCLAGRWARRLLDRQFETTVHLTGQLSAEICYQPQKGMTGWRGLSMLKCLQAWHSGSSSRMLTVEALLCSDDGVLQPRCSLIVPGCSICDRSCELDFVDLLPQVHTATNVAERVVLSNIVNTHKAFACQPSWSWHLVLLDSRK